MTTEEVAKNKTYKVEEVEKHSTGEDCWIIYESRVYDVTSFLMEHPGGEDLILGEAGRDATDAFENAAHSTKAREMLSKYVIGEVDPDDLRASNEEKAASRSAKGGSAGTGFSISSILSVRLSYRRSIDRAPC